MRLPEDRTKAGTIIIFCVCRRPELFDVIRYLIFALYHCDGSTNHQDKALQDNSKDQYQSWRNNTSI
jgi:hypothetical protein